MPSKNIKLRLEPINRPSLVGNWGLSSALKRFVWKAPHHRLGILQFVSQFAAALPAGSRVLDVGAGSAPYRELFQHCSYKTSDLVAGKTPVDYLCPIDRFPLPDQSFDAILGTEILEHVPDPVAALKELRRLLAPGGFLGITVPFLLGIHEKRDFYRFTRDCLQQIFTQSGLHVTALTPRWGLPMTVWSFFWLFSLWVARPERPAGFLYQLFRLLLGSGLLAFSVVSFFFVYLIDRFDKRQDSTVGYAVLAQRPS